MFTAADISAIYALEFARRSKGFVFGEAEQAYVARTTQRDAYKRAMEIWQDTKAWNAGVSGQ
jgi:hypothetical protein